VTEIVAPLQHQRIAQNQKLLAYQGTAIDDQAADQAIMAMYRNDVINVQRIADVVEQWERPAHDWGDKTAWRLFNAAAFALAGKVPKSPTPRNAFTRSSTAFASVCIDAPQLGPQVRGLFIYPEYAW
jgi:hypothetical protein